MNNKFTIRVYVVDLAAYNDGLFRGKWITLPTTEEELYENLRNLTNNFENDYAIFDYEAPFEISEYVNLKKLNEIMETLSTQFQGVEYKVIEALATGLDGYEYMEDVEYTVHEAKDLEELGEQVIGSDIPNWIKYYFDYERYASDMVINGNFVQGDGFYVEIHNYCI